ncbi:hypothetical protein FRB97_007497 [Tulasnella sp. 331]|nr:hypothetical protein FRB97_007497 [Tulasnella sp. 331]
MVQTRGKRVDYSELAEDGSSGEAPDEEGRWHSCASQEQNWKKQRVKKPQDEYEYAPRPKAVKKERVKGKGSRMAGKLDGLMNLPVDIFAEVCSHLRPLDLLHLARANKRLRQLLTSQDSSPLWRRARSSIKDLPDCPSDLSEPKMCSRRELLVHHNLTIPEDILQAMPYATAAETGQTTRRYDQTFFLVPMVHSVIARMEGLANGAEPYNHFIMALKQECAALFQTGAAMYCWHADQSDMKATEAMEATNKREDAIHEKLIELGWTESDFPSHDYDWNNMVRQPRELTATIWKRIHPKLIPILETTRRNRLQFEKAARADRRRFTITQFYSDLVGAAMMADSTLRRSMLPKNGDVRLIPVVKRMAEEDTECVTREMWDEVIDEIKAGVQDWRTRVQKKLIKILSDGREVIEDPEKMSEAKVDKGKQKASFIGGGYESDESVNGGMPWFVGRPSEREGSPSSIWADENPEPEPCASTSGPGPGSTSTEGGAVESSNSTDPSSQAGTASADILRLASSTFDCSECEETLWYPLVLEHRHCLKGGTEFMSFTSKKLRSSAAHRNTVRRLIADLGLDEACTYADAVALESCLLCKRCDPQLSIPMSFEKLANHYDEERSWYSKVTRAVAQSRHSAYPTRSAEDPLPILHDPHSLDLSEPLAASLSAEEVETHVAQQTRYSERNQVLAEDLKEVEEHHRGYNSYSDDYSDGYSDEEYDDWWTSAPRSDKRAIQPAAMEIHIRTKHQKEPDLEIDSSRDIRGSEEYNFGGSFGSYFPGLFSSLLW